QDFHFVMKMNKASASLGRACASGQHIAFAELNCRKAGTTPQVFLKIKMSDVLVSSYQTGGSSHGEVVPIDQISINFAKIEYEYKPQKADVSLSPAQKAGYDLKLNKKV